MKNFKYNKNLMSFLTSSMLVLTLTGCGVSKTVDNANYDEIKYGKEASFNESMSSSFENVSECVTDNTLSTSEVLTEDVIKETITNCTEPVTSTIVDTYTDVVSSINQAEKNILDHFNNLGNEIKNYIDSEELLEKGKAYFIYCVDFIFFDEPINGVTFSELSDSVKQQILENISDIDTLICSRYPNYKETISDKYNYIYNNASALIKKGSINIKEFSKEKLGEENVEKIQEFKDLVKEQISNNYDDLSEYASKGKEKVKSWYEEFKQN